MKITLTDLASLQNETSAVNAINDNNQTLMTAFDNTLSRDGTGPNTMGAQLDMNSNDIINLPTPTSNYSPLRLVDANTVNGAITVSPLPTGGTVGQVLAKNSSTNFDVSWKASSTAAILGGDNIILTGAGPTTISTSLSPSFTSVTTTSLSGFTLGGTISGGGHQINNVIIGNSNPLPANFTNVTGTGISCFGTNSSLPSGTIFSISNNTASVVPSMFGFAPQLVVVGADNTRGEMALQSFGTTGGESCILLFSARGTMAAPTHSVSGDFVSEIFSHPYDGTNFAHNAGAGFISVLTEDTTPSAAGQRMDVWTTPTTTSTAVKSATFHSSGGYSVGTATDPGIGAILANTSIKSQSSTAGIGYATGAGGAVTQATSRTTGVALNSICGSITLVSAAGAGAWTTFTVTNSSVTVNDVVIVSQRSGTDKYTAFTSAVTAGSFNITFSDVSGTTTEQPVFNFVIIKAVNT